MPDIFLYFVRLPAGINEMVVPCLDGYTVYIDEDLDRAHRVSAYRHAGYHILNDDHSAADVGEIEERAHRH